MDLVPQQLPGRRYGRYPIISYCGTGVMADTTPGDVAARGNLEQDLSFTRREITMPVVALLL